MTPEVRQRLAKLVPMLSSNQPGEVAATAAAIGRTLRAGGADWHALAAEVGGEALAPGFRAPPPNVAALESQLHLERMLTSKLRAEVRDLKARLTIDEKAARTVDLPPRWGRLSRVARIAWLDRFRAAGFLSPVDDGWAHLLRRQLYERPHDQPERSDRARFNKLLGVYLASVRESAVGGAAPGG